MGLERPGDDLTRAGRTFIHQHHHGDFPENIAVGSRPNSAFNASAGAFLGHHRAFPEEEVGDGRSTFQQATRVPPKIEHNPTWFRIKLSAQRVPGLDQIQVRISGKLVEAEVADLGLSVEAPVPSRLAIFISFKDLEPLHRGNLNALPWHIKDQKFFNIRSANFQLDRGAFRTRNAVHRIIQAPIGNQGAINRNNHILVLNAQLPSW